jgi:hypothetical protein
MCTDSGASTAGAGQRRSSVVGTDCTHDRASVKRIGPAQSVFWRCVRRLDLARRTAIVAASVAVVQVASQVRCK